MKAIVAGMIATYPLGGVAWDYGQYLLGLERLGFEVTYLEDAGVDGYDPRTGMPAEDLEYGCEFLARSLAAMSPTLADRWHVRSAGGATSGLTPADLDDAIAEADLFLNVSGASLVRPRYRALAQRMVLIDTDPGWNHFVEYAKWDAGKRWADESILGYRSHDSFFTYALNIGRPGCNLPTLGLDWRPTRPPVVLDAWHGRGGGSWSTVMTWDNFRRPIEHDGEVYGSKELEFPKIESLPRETGARLEVAVGGSTAPRDRWRELGWSVIDADAVSRTADDYRNYIETSRGELSVAKNVYVATRSGWFSCRSACYLAAGRPVIVQDTGFSDFMPTGSGLLAWTTCGEAAAALAAVEADYENHAAAAREVAEAELDATRVLGDLLEQAGVGA